MSKLTVSIGSKDFDITLEEEFAKFFEEDFKETFDQKSSIETKELLYAYVQKSYDEFISKKEYNKMLKKINNII